MENVITYMERYSPCFPFLARAIANALENGKAIISPTVINKIPITNMPVHEVRLITKKLKATSNNPNKVKPIFERFNCSHQWINGISNKKMNKPFKPKSNPISTGVNVCTSL